MSVQGVTVELNQQATVCSKGAPLSLYWATMTLRRAPGPLEAPLSLDGVTVVFVKTPMA